jgi:hypothetical protein
MHDTPNLRTTVCHGHHRKVGLRTSREGAQNRRLRYLAAWFEDRRCEDQRLFFFFAEHQSRPKPPLRTLRLARGHRFSLACSRPYLRLA